MKKISNYLATINFQTVLVVMRELNTLILSLGFDELLPSSSNNRTSVCCPQVSLDTFQSWSAFIASTNSLSIRIETVGNNLLTNCNASFLSYFFNMSNTWMFIHLTY